jgi:hypothetical protein
MENRKLFSNFDHLIHKSTDFAKTLLELYWDPLKTCSRPRQDLPETSPRLAYDLTETLLGPTWDPIGTQPPEWDLREHTQDLIGTRPGPLWDPIISAQDPVGTRLGLD